jgi:hypothetical protein
MRDAAAQQTVNPSSPAPVKMQAVLPSSVNEAASPAPLAFSSKPVNVDSDAGTAVPNPNRHTSLQPPVQMQV